MKRRWILLGIVVSVNLLLECAAIGTEPFVGPHWLISYAVIAIPASHGSLLGFWAALGGRATPWRLVVAAVGAVAAMRLLAQSELMSDEPAMFVFLLLLQMGVVSLVLMIARFLGAELTDVRPDAAAPVAPDRQWIQFSLGSLLSWTTAVAVLLATLHYLPRTAFEDFFSDPAQIAILAAILGAGTLIALGAVWITLGVRWPVGRYILLFLSSGIGIVVMSIVIGSDEVHTISIFCVTQIVCVTGSLWLVRLAGYRLIWRRRVRL